MFQSHELLISEPFRKGEYSGGLIKVDETGSGPMGESGEVKPDGIGVWTTEKQDAWYGEFTAGEPNGLFAIIYSDGSQYFGPCKGFKRGRGVGRFAFPDGREYVGEFRNDQMTGTGKMRHLNGCFEGTFVDGKMIAGTDVLHYGEVYKGSFNNFKRDGTGELWAPNIDVYYKGDFQNDHRHGFGSEKNSKGTVFEGDYRNDKRFGGGILLIRTDERIYQKGIFSEDKCLVDWGIFIDPSAQEPAPLHPLALKKANVPDLLNMADLLNVPDPIDVPLTAQGPKEMTLRISTFLYELGAAVGSLAERAFEGCRVPLGDPCKRQPSHCARHFR